MQKFDYLIAGMGIAGVTLAHQLVKRGCSILIYNAKSNHSSKVAAGLYNPITGRKMVKTWMADQLFPYLQTFYKNVEKETNTSFLEAKTIYRPFISVEEQNDWQGRSSDPAFASFIKNVHTKPEFEGKFKDPYGGIALKSSGWVDTRQYIEGSIRYFQSLENIKIVTNKLTPEELIVNETGFSIEEYSADKMVFCDGIELNDNPYFNWLPLQLLKGELLDVSLPFTTEAIFNRGVFVLPIGGGLYRVGSTYNKKDKSLTITEDGRKQLEQNLRQLITVDYEIVGQQAGLRPTTRDRRPFIGEHPEYQNMFIFNGLGTKGVSLAPYFSKHLLEVMEQKESLAEEINIKRFLSLYKE